LNCKDYIHPFQNDPGTSQAQRVMDDLLSGAEKIDARTLADLLDYFVQLSKQINYYDENLGTRDWLPFFKDSLPFMITAMLKFDQETVGNKISKYRKKFNYRPSKAALQTLVKYEYKTLIIQLNTWYQQVRNKSLIIEGTLQNLITKNGRDKVRAFIIGANNAARYFRIKQIDFSELIKDDPNSNVWGLVNADLYNSDPDSVFNVPGTTKRQRLINLYNSIADLTTTFINIIHSVIGAAEMSLTDSFENLRDDLKQRYTPHHALLFAFLKLFQHLQDELNLYTKKHLDFFYQEVLQLVPKEAVADQAHIVFDIQKALNAYALQAGLLVKDSKDNNKEDILFSLDEDIVINKAQVKDLRTLFVNNQFVQDDAYVQGVYMAPVATKADGIDKDFPDDQPTKSWPTVGSHLSKYIDPENKFVHPYPNARIAFLMASPVLLLNEGTRTIEIKLDCRLKQNYCAGLTEQAGGNNNNCCDENAGTISEVDSSTGLPMLYDSSTLYKDIILLLTGDSTVGSPYSSDGTYYYINRDLIAQAVKLGISNDVKNILEGFLTVTKTKTAAINKVLDPGTICYCDEDIPLFEATVPSDKYTGAITDPAYTLLRPIFPPQRALNVTFSGEKNWIVPKLPATFSFASLTLTPDIDVDMPVVKIELNDKIKLFEDSSATVDERCCFRPPGSDKQEVSAYHFFRNVLIDPTSTIKVTVCGLKNFIVQNDESLQDVNKPVYPFGTRPTVIDFNIKSLATPPPPKPLPNTRNLVGPNFYIGSQEVFGKIWSDVYINIKWKDLPENFRDYYKGYWMDKVDPTNIGLDKEEFQANISVLQKGLWKGESLHNLPSPPLGETTVNNNNGDAYNNRKLFRDDHVFAKCAPTGYDQTIYVSNGYFGGLSQEFLLDKTKITKYEASSYYGFLKLNLQNQDFLHKDYPFVLARQMLAMGKLPDQKVEDAVYFNQAGDPIVFSTSQIVNDLTNAQLLITNMSSKITTIHDDALNPPNDVVNTDIKMPQSQNIRDNYNDTSFLYPNPVPPNPPIPMNLIQETAQLQTLITNDQAIVDPSKKYQAIIPNEPWTPIIQNISIDYVATATSADISLIHLYPYQNTYKKEELQLEPAMFPTFCDEGTLFIGLDSVVPGSNVSFLFQLAEATSDTEDDLEPVQWHYLDNNTWKELRTGFEVLEDNSNNLSTSGIVKIAMPGNIGNTNTVLPAGLYWVKATIGSNSGIISETIAIYTQAVKATFTNTAANDKLRLDTSLAAGSLSKLNEADANVKLVSQPYDSFGGRVPETESYFYVHVSEILRHKGRAIQKFDYERLALDICPQVFKAKCINHSFALNAHRYINDYPMAPGYVLLAVIPDLTKINASGSFEPRLPLSMLEKLETKLRALTSPFVRLRAMNPRYEKVDFCLRVKLLDGKDENFYKEQLKKDIETFMAPWAVGSYDKLNFGQVINRSDFIRFLEQQNYIDYITEFLWRHDEDKSPGHETPVDQPEIFPITPRSILIAGHIDICILSKDCPDWDKPDINIYCENKPMKIADYCNDILK
jgi:hypothetical protein